MDEIYFLNFQGEAIEFFRSPKLFNSERSLIVEMECFDRSSRIHLIDTQLKFIFERFDSINHRSNHWQGNLKTLLAHDCYITTASNRTLAKSFSPVRFFPDAGWSSSRTFWFLLQRKRPRPCRADIEFCNVTEYPLGIHAYIIESVLSLIGGAVIAIEPEANTTLIMRARQTDIITGDDSVILFLSKSGRVT